MASNPKHSGNGRIPSKTTRRSECKMHGATDARLPGMCMNKADMSNFRQLADFRLFCLVLGHSCESSRSGLIFTSVGGGGVSLGPIRIVYFLLNTK